jgi:hypothetical protein
MDLTANATVEQDKPAVFLFDFVIAADAQRQNATSVSGIDPLADTLDRHRSRID